MPAFSYREEVRRKADTHQIKPTLLIGLGGTGKEVLLRLRQRFIEKYSMVGFPTMAYLWIDTDVQNQNIDGRPIDYIDQEARFKEGEWADAQVSDNNFQAIFGNRNQHRHIFTWIYPSLAAQGSVLNGSRQIRPLGRLGFFQAYPAIQRRLDSLKNHIMDQKTRQEMLDGYGIQVDPSNALQVIIVCSVAGGTGSGMFLDTAFLLRSMFADANPDIVGYLVLPPVFAPAVRGKESIYANAYAALKELEFYSMRKDLRQGEASQQVESGTRFTSAHDFVVDWTNTGTPVAIQGPPFNTCYLINNQTLGGGSIGPDHKTHLCDMLAENIFMDFHAHAFSEKKRSVRSNLDDSLTGELEFKYLDSQGEPIHSEIFSCRFSTMGFTMMYVPTDRIRKACGYQLALDILDRWLMHHDVPATLEDSMRERMLPQLSLRVTRAADDFRTALERSNDRGQTFWQEIADAWSDREKRSLRDRVQAAAPNLKAEIDRRMQNYAKDMIDKPSEQEHWGAFVRRLELVNRKAFLETAQSAIIAMLKTWLKTDQIRFAAATDYLRTLHLILEKRHDSFTRITRVAAQTAEQLRSEIRALSDIIDQEEHGLWVHRWSLRVLVEDICEKIGQYFEQQMRRLLFGTAAELARELQVFIGQQTTETRTDGSEVVTRAGLIRELWRLTEHLQAMRTDFQDKLAAFERAEEHLIFENLYTPGMFKAYYQLQRPDGTKGPVDLRQMEQLFFADVGLDGPYDLKDEAEKIGMTNVRRELERFCLSRFDHLEVDVDAIHTFYGAYPDALRRRQILERFIRNGTVWLQPSTRARVERNITANYDDDLEIGMFQGGMQHAHYQETYSVISQLGRATSLRSGINLPVNVQKDAVYLYSEIAGIPLVYIDNIEAYKQAYMGLIRSGRELHINSQEDQYADIVIQDSVEIIETIRINRILFVGAILRIVEVSGREGRQVQYSYLDQGVLSPRRVPLGNQAVAVETLRANQPLLARIEQQVNEVKRTLSLLAHQRFLATLMYHTADGSLKGGVRGPYPPTYITVGGQQIERFSPEHRAIEAVILEERPILAGLMDADQDQIQQKMVGLLNQLDDFSEAITVGSKTHRILTTKALKGVHK